MEVGIHFFPTAEGTYVGTVAQGVEERGLESLFVPEHSHFPAGETAFRDPEGRPLDERYRRLLDPFVALSAAAAVTTRIRLGTAACILTQRDVILTAKAAASLDHVSRGRLLFGVGAGWNFDELRTHGVDPEQRFTIFAESIAAITEIWQHERPEFHDRHVDFGPIWCWPKPVQLPRPPVLVAGNGPSVLDRVLRCGDGWLPSHRGGGLLQERIRTLRCRASELSRPSPSVTFVAASADERELYDGREAGLDRILLPVPPGPPAATERALDDCERAWGRVRG